MAAYTSSDEFDIDRRVWMTNEVPPYDMYRALNSSMQNGLWKWILGSSNVEYDLPHKIYEETGGYVHDENADEVYLKMTNGRISPEYGPVTSNEPGDINFNPKYNRIEIDGVLLPEFDLLLHEVYRYLETIYPDHPNEDRLLTETEFNDMILAAGDMMNYMPDVKFFDKVAKSLDTGMSNDETLKEASKLKIRNLLDNTFRRKLYGSKAGYRMFANDIFQLCTIFPVATYLPISPIDKAQIDKEHNTKNNLAALSALNMTRQEYVNYSRQNNRQIDTTSELYYRKFRLVDWDGKDSSFLQKADRSIYFYGYSIPYNENSIFEYPNLDDIVSEVDTIESGSFFENKNDVKGVTYVNELGKDVFEVTLDKKSVNILDEKGNVIGVEINAEEVPSVTKEVHLITTSKNNYIPYRTTYIYPEMEKILDSLPEENLVELNNLWNTHFSIGAEVEAVFNYLESTYSVIKKITIDNLDPLEELNVIKNPFIKDTLLLEPSKSLSFYPMDVDVEGSSERLTVKQDEILNTLGIIDKYIGTSDLTDKNTVKLRSLYYINGFTKGRIKYTPNEHVELTNIPTLNEDARYAIVVNTIHNKKAILLGKLDPEFAQSGNVYTIASVSFDITAIPEYKSEEVVKTIYPESKELFIFHETNELEINKYINSGLTTLGCEDVINISQTEAARIFPCDQLVTHGLVSSEKASSDEKAKEVAEEIVGGTKFGISCKGSTFYYYKPLSVIEGKPVVISLDSEICSIEAACITYQTYCGRNYINFVEVYINQKAIEEQLDEFKENRSLLKETRTYTNDITIDLEDYSTFEAGTICPGCEVDYIASLAIFDGLKVYAPLPDYRRGSIDYISLGNLNVLPIITDGNEVCTPYIYAPDDEGNYSVELNEGQYKEYTRNDTTLYYPDVNWYHDTTHPKESVKLPIIDSTVLYRNNNKQLFSDICGDEDSNDYEIDDVDWFAGFDRLSSSNKNILVSPISIQNVKIECVVDATTEGMDNVISFKNAVSQERSKFISIGDTVFGPSLDTDDNKIYVTSIGFNSVTVNTKLTQSGTFMFTFACKLHAVAEDVSENMYIYKDSLDTNGIYSIINPFAHGLWGSPDFPIASNAILESLPDISFYKPYNYLTSNYAIEDGVTSGISSFKEVMEKIHPIEEGKGLVRVPSTIKFMNDLFIELNLNKLIWNPTITGKNPTLMSVEWLDYIEDNLKDISRATDHTNVGVNLMMETDSTGYYTLDTRISYTDPNIRLKFITMNFDNLGLWNNYHAEEGLNWTVPCYAQIGTGGEGRFDWFRSPADITYPNIWGDNVYDSDNITKENLDLLQKENGRLRKRSTWGQDDTTTGEEVKGNSRYHSVEKPLFEIPLGEYDVQTRYFANDEKDLNKAYTTVQSSFYQETFNNITKYISSDDDNSKASPIIVSENSLVSISPIKAIDGYETIQYLGDGAPTKELNDNGLYDLVYPKMENTGEFYTIGETLVLSELGGANEEMESKTFTHHTLILKDSENKVRTIVMDSIGLLGDGGALNEDDGFDHKFDSMGINFIPDGDLVDYMTYITLTTHGISVSHPGQIYNSFFNDILTATNSFNKIFWFVYIGNTKDRTFDINGVTVNQYDIIGLLTPDVTTSFDKSDLKAVLFNRCYYTSTLPITRKYGISDEIYKLMIDSSFTPTRELNDGTTVVTLPRRCITEGSYNFDYTINPELRGSGYLYTSSKSNEMKYESNDDLEYDSIENDNFDVIDKSKECEFDLTRSAIYKDDKNNAFYTYTDKYRYVGDTKDQDCSDKLKKVAIKFAEQKYFKNTTHLSGSYRSIVSQATGSKDTKRIPEFRGISGAGEFNASLISSGDRVLKITPMSLRSIWTKFLEPTFFANYYDLEGIIRGADESGNLIVSYENLDSQKAPVERLNFTSTLKNYLPVDKRFDDKLEKYITVPYKDTYYDFENNDDFPAPTIGDVDVTKSILSEDPEEVYNYDFKYFKNLLLLRGSVSTQNPNKIIAANNDNGQFATAVQFIKRGDEVYEGVTLSTNIASSLSEIRIIIDGSPNKEPQINHASWDEIGKTFFAVSDKGYIYIAHDVDYEVVNEIKVKEYAIKDFDPAEEKITGISFDRASALWFVNMTRNGQSYIRSVPSNFETGLNGATSVTTSIPYSHPQSILNPNNYETVNITEDTILSSKDEFEFVNENEDLKKTHYNFKAGEISIAEIEYTGNKQFNYKSAPFNFMGYNFKASADDPAKVNTFYAKDRNSDYEVYGLGRGIFIKAPVPLCNENGIETGEVSKDFYWKYVEAPLFQETTLGLYKNLVNEGTNSAYSTASDTRSYFLDRFNFLESTPTWVVYDPERKAYFQTDGKGNIPKENEPNTWYETRIEGQEWSNYYMGITTLNEGLSDDDKITPELALTRYYPLYKKAESIKIISWKSLAEGSSGIEDAIKKAKSNPGLDYYLYFSKTEKDINYFTINTSAPSGLDYLKFRYLEEDNKYKITYFGVGKYKHATTTDGIIDNLEISSLYGMDLNFSERDTYIVEDGDKEWYASYLSNICCNAFLESDYTELFISTIKKAIFTIDRILFVNENGTIVYINKDDTYRKESLTQSLNWHLSNTPQTLSYTHMTQNEFAVTREVKYGPGSNDVFAMSVTDGYFIDSIFTPNNVYEDDTVIIICGNIKSRHTIEKDFSNNFKLDVGKNVAQFPMSNIIGAAKYLDQPTPMTIYSTNGGLEFHRMDTVLDIPGFELHKADMKTFLPGETILQQSYWKDGINNVYWVPENKNNLTISGIHKLNGKYHYYLESSDGSRFGYELQPTMVEDSFNFKSVEVVEVKSSTSRLTSSKQERYNAFETFTDGSSSVKRISNVSLGVGKMTVTSVDTDSITLDNGVVPQLKGNEENAIIEVLLSFKTHFTVSPSVQLKCINKNFLPEYFKPTKAELRIRPIIEVPSLGLADRVYSFRETLTSKERLENTSGYKAVSEDVNHKFYEYNQFFDDNNDELFDLKYAKNGLNYFVYLCDVNGDYISGEDGDEVNGLTIKQLLESAETTVDYSKIFKKFGKPKYESLAEANTDSTLRDTDKSFPIEGLKKITRINAKYSTTLPCENLYNPEGIEVLKTGYVIYQSTIENRNYVTVGTKVPEGYQPRGKVDSLKDCVFTDLTDYFEYDGITLPIVDSFVALGNNFTDDFVKNYLYVIPENPEEKEDLRYKILNIMDKSSSVTYSNSPWFNLDKRLIEKTITVGSKKYNVFFDAMLNYFPLKSNRFVTFKFRSRFANNLPLTMYVNETFDKVLGPESRSDPITGIYLPQRGYGGTRLRNDTNNTWDDVLPWDLDPDAFDNDYLVNRYGENITLCNNAGVEIISNNGETLVDNNDKISIKGRDIKNGSYKNIELFKFNNNSKNLINTVKISKPTASIAVIWTSQDDVYIKFDKEAGYQDLANVRYAEPSRFILSDLDLSKVTLESAKVEDEFVEDTNLTIQDGILKYNLPESVIDYPKFIRISYKLNDEVNLTKILKIIQISTSNISNIIYSTLEPTLYYKSPTHKDYEMLMVGKVDIINNNTDSRGANDIFDNSFTVGTRNADVWPTKKVISVSETENIEINLPVFNIGETKSFYFYDYDEDKYLIESFIGDLRIREGLVETTIEDDIYTTKFVSPDTKFTFVLSQDSMRKPSKPEAYLKLLPGSTFTPVYNSLYIGNPNQNHIKSEFLVKNNSGSKVSIKGVRGPVYMRKPSYNSFRVLTSLKGYIIKSYEDIYNFKRDGDLGLLFTLIESNKIEFDKGLTSTAILKDSDLDDGYDHFLRFEVLTQKSVPLAEDLLNDEEYFTEIELSDIKTFPPDRVFFNERGYPKSPVLLNNTIYRSENNTSYTQEYFVNTNNSYIRECDETGKYIRYYVKNGKLASRPLLKGVDRLVDAFIPHRPNYLSCQEWFENEFFLKEKESNPFWQVINLKASFNNITQTWTQNLTLNKFERVGATIKQVPVTNEEAYLKLRKASSAKIIDNEIKQDYNTDYLDLFDGEIRFIALQPDSQLYTDKPENKLIIKYGICAQNTLIGRSFGKLGDKYANYPGYFQSSYTVNSRKNMANTHDKDSAIVEITEMGLFNKDHVLIAYAVFPPIEYRSDSQHISFTSFIKYGSCSVDDVEDKE